MSRTLTLLAALLAFPVVSSCNAPASLPPQRFAFRIASDPDRPLAGVHLNVGGQLAAISDEAGLGFFALAGNDGETFDVTVDCPAGYQSPPQPTAVTIRRLTSADRVAEYHVACPPTTRAVVIAVSGQMGRRLAILQLGQEVARTEASGVATLLLRPGPTDQIDLTLDTSGPENADLRPQNPTATFLVKNRDDVFLFEPHFLSVKSKPAVARKAAPKAPIGPIRIQ